ncbi:MAG TPA: NAD-dependent epimerase/dehydratase family protein [Casimicrobiaceae bacterium]
MVLSEGAIAVTGADGFIGAAYCRRLAERGQRVRRVVHEQSVPGGNDDTVALDLGRAHGDEIARALRGASAVVHLAGRAHVMKETARDAEAVYKFANVDMTERVALAAVGAGVRRFIFASTVKVNGESTLPGKPFRPGDAPSPRDAYARSKLAAERTLAQVASGTSMIATSLRLPLVYGPGARGNFRRLVDAVAARRFLPLGAIDNRRSLVALDNLMDAFDALLVAPTAVIGTHFVADAPSVSTPSLVRAVASALGVAPRLISVPVSTLRLAGALSGHAEAVARLTDSLEVDTASLARATGWKPRPLAIDAATVRVTV